MNKKLRLFFLLALMVGVCAFSFGACKENGSDDTSSKQEEKVPQENLLTLEEESFSLIVGDERYVVASYEAQEGLVAQYKSSDESVVSVDANGKIVGLGQGVATITVTYGTESATCEVRVGFGNILPNFMLSQIMEESVTVKKSDILNLEGYVLFNGKQYYDVEMEYTLSEPSVGEVVNGIFTPKTTGATDIAIKGCWRGFEGFLLEESFSVTVISSVEFSINNGQTEFTLHNKAKVGDNTYTDTEIPFVVSVKEDEEPLEYTVQVVEGTDIVAYESGMLSVIDEKCGTAKVRVAYTDSTQVEFTQEYKIIVEPSVGTHEKEIQFSFMKGELPLAEIFGKDVTIVRAVEDGKELFVENNKVFGVSHHAQEKPEPCNITVYTENEGYEITVIPYAMIIEKAEDLAVLHLADETEMKTTLDGYYLVKNDIDASEYTHASHGAMAAKMNSTNFSSYAKKGFIGVFDGDGHTISGLTVGYSGLFGTIGSGVVKNIAFTNVKFMKNTQLSQYGLSFGLINARLENVYMHTAELTQLSTNKYCNRALMAGEVRNATLINCVVETEKVTVTNDYQGMVGSLWSRNISVSGTGQGSWMNVYVFSDHILYKDYRTDVNMGYKDAGNRLIDDETNAMTNVTRYDTRATMEALEEKPDLSGFDSKYWETASGSPIWKVEGQKTVFNSGVVKTLDQSAPTVDVSVELAKYDLTKIVSVESVEEGVTAEYKNNTLVLKKDGTRLTADGENHGVIFYGENYGVRVDFTLYTKVIDKASDFAEFNLGETAKIIDGYYILSKNIDASTYTHAAHSGTHIGGNNNAGESYFSGTFDGNGYTISGITLDNYGFFGVVKDGTIKNVAFTNVKYAKNQFLFTLARLLNGATIENVYLHTELFTITKNGASYRYNERAMVAQRIVATNIDALIVEVDAFESVDLTYSTQSNSLGSWVSANITKSGTWSNVYVLSDVYLYAYHNGEKLVGADASNQPSLGGVVYQDIMRYNDRAEMEKQMLDLSAFNSAYWEITSGSPVWKNAK